MAEVKEKDRLYIAEESAQKTLAAIACHLLQKAEGEVRIKREELEQTINGKGSICITGDIHKDEYIITLQTIEKGDEDKDSREEFIKEYKKEKWKGRLEDLI